MDIRAKLYNHFGFSTFRAGQEEAIRSLLSEQHTLAVMPTGAGKSLIFQLAALQLTGITLVISPLIALMKDQVDSFNRRNISAAYINSALPASEQNLRL
ncbi:MAG TPA: DEAD/DEAH box helicase [Anaerolineales bacterium]|nr:DEAD/DEAH box helicase [Anaerolineales bacterium]HNO92884.1 DEAD/DEAH box helicase [Anaerolineales bacterium]